MKRRAWRRLSSQTSHLLLPLLSHNCAASPHTAIMLLRNKRGSLLRTKPSYGHFLYFCCGVLPGKTFCFAYHTFAHACFRRAAFRRAASAASATCLYLPTTCHHATSVFCQTGLVAVCWVWWYIASRLCLPSVLGRTCRAWRPLALPATPSLRAIPPVSAAPLWFQTVPSFARKADADAHRHAALRIWVNRPYTATRFPTFLAACNALPTGCRPVGMTADWDGMVEQPVAGLLWFGSAFLWDCSFFAPACSIWRILPALLPFADCLLPSYLTTHLPTRVAIPYILWCSTFSSPLKLSDISLYQRQRKEEDDGGRVGILHRATCLHAPPSFYHPGLPSTSFLPFLTRLAAAICGRWRLRDLCHSPELADVLYRTKATNVRMERAGALRRNNAANLFNCRD